MDAEIERRVKQAFKFVQRQLKMQYKKFMVSMKEQQDKTKEMEKQKYKRRVDPTLTKSMRDRVRVDAMTKRLQQNSRTNELI